MSVLNLVFLYSEFALVIKQLHTHLRAVLLEQKIYFMVKFVKSLQMKKVYLLIYLKTLTQQGIILWLLKKTPFLKTLLYQLELNKEQ